jgi:15-cis-phytoene synthase
MGSDLTLSPSDMEMKGGRSSFFYSFSFLPKPKRDAIRTVYQFCRTTDDIVDNSGDVTSNIERLTKWRWELDRAIKGKSEYAVLNRLNEIAVRFNIPVNHFYDLIRGVEMDLVKNRYETFDELREYCLLVASSVGLMCLEIFRPRNAKTREYAVNLGIALQLTNIIRDVSIDASFGRIYLPVEDLRRFGYTESDLLAHNYTAGFRALMEFETKRAEEYFTRAQESLPREDRRTMFAAKIMERIYYHTLLRIKEADYNVFEKSVSLPRSLQLLIAIKYWIKHYLFAA